MNHIYEKDKDREIAPLDKLIERKHFDTPIKTITTISEDKRVTRLTKGFNIYEERQKRLYKK